MNAYGILAALAIMACLAGWGSWEARKVDKLQGQMDSLKASYATTAANAKLDAQAQEAKDLDILHAQQVKALAESESKTQQAQSQLQDYLQKGKANKGTDIGHACFNTPIPADLLPGQK